VVERKKERERERERESDRESGGERERKRERETTNAICATNSQLAGDECRNCTLTPFISLSLSLSLSLTLLPTHPLTLGLSSVLFPKSL
jgi:hypothetical protein